MWKDHVYLFIFKKCSGFPRKGGGLHRLLTYSLYAATCSPPGEQVAAHRLSNLKLITQKRKHHCKKIHVYVEVLT